MKRMVIISISITLLLIVANAGALTAFDSPIPTAPRTAPTNTPTPPLSPLPSPDIHIQTAVTPTLPPPIETPAPPAILPESGGVIN